MTAVLKPLSRESGVCDQECRNDGEGRIMKTLVLRPWSLCRGVRTHWLPLRADVVTGVPYRTAALMPPKESELSRKWSIFEKCSYHFLTTEKVQLFLFFF